MKALVRHIKAGTRQHVEKDNQDVLFNNRMTQFCGKVIDVKWDPECETFLQEEPNCYWHYPAQWLDFNVPDFELEPDILMAEVKRTPLYAQANDLTFVEPMINYIGEIIPVIEMPANDYHLQPFYEQMGSTRTIDTHLKWHYAAEWLDFDLTPEPVVEELPVKLIQRGNVVYARWKAMPEPITYATCNETDTFDPKVALAICCMHQMFSNEQIKDIIAESGLKADKPKDTTPLEEIVKNLSKVTGEPFTFLKIFDDEGGSIEIRDIEQPFGTHIIKSFLGFDDLRRAFAELKKEKKGKK